MSNDYSNLIDFFEKNKEKGFYFLKKNETIDQKKDSPDIFLEIIDINQSEEEIVFKPYCKLFKNKDKTLYPSYVISFEKIKDYINDPFEKLFEISKFLIADVLKSENLENVEEGINQNKKDIVFCPNNSFWKLNFIE